MVDVYSYAKRNRYCSDEVYFFAPEPFPALYKEQQALVGGR